MKPALTTAFILWTSFLISCNTQTEYIYLPHSTLNIEKSLYSNARDYEYYLIYNPPLDKAQLTRQMIAKADSLIRVRDTARQRDHQIRFYRRTSRTSVAYKETGSDGFVDYYIYDYSQDLLGTYIDRACDSNPSVRLRKILVVDSADWHIEHPIILSNDCSTGTDGDKERL